MMLESLFRGIAYGIFTPRITECSERRGRLAHTKTTFAFQKTSFCALEELILKISQIMPLIMAHYHSGSKTIENNILRIKNCFYKHSVF